MAFTDSLDFISANLREFELYPWMAQSVDKVLEDFCLDLNDSREKYRDTLSASSDRIREMLTELGFSYINDILNATNDEAENLLLSLSGVLSLLKGHREGLTLVMKLLGFDITILEWWEKTPKGEPHTFDMEILINAANVNSVEDTVSRIRDFVQEYVYPRFDIASLVFTFDFAQAKASHAGFIDVEQTLCIEGTI